MFQRLGHTLRFNILIIYLNQHSGKVDMRMYISSDIDAIFETKHQHLYPVILQTFIASFVSF